ncbi:MAG: lysophospholipid acyltransferase family protein [Azospirillaceae bacterium]
MLFLRSLAFNIAMHGFTALCLVGLVWLLATPRRFMMAVVRWYLRMLARIERWVMGIDYRVVGLEHLPAGPYLVAAKHQSMWETMKLHLLFGDPAVVIKRELLSIPIWGWFARKARLIAVDRGRGGKAVQSMVDNAAPVVAEGRPIVIFPQGTRVAAGAYKPYKIGIAALYAAYDLPVVPMALNSGLFWGRRSFTKRPGTITVELLPPIQPGLERDDFMARLESTLEEACERLSLDAGGPPTRYPPGAPADRPRTLAPAED